MPAALRLKDGPATEFERPGVEAFTPVLDPACAGVAAETTATAARAASGGTRGCARGAEVEKLDSMQEATCASRAVSEPSGPLGGSSEWQMGHSSSSAIGSGAGGGGGDGAP